MQQFYIKRILDILPFNKKFLFYFLTIFIFLNIVSLAYANQNNSNKSSDTSISNNKKENKNILVIIFPGGKSHHFVMKKLFDFAINDNNRNQFNYNFHILVHNYDKDFWRNAPSSYKIYGFGDRESFDVIFNKSLEKVREDPVFGYQPFSKAMVHILEEFANSEIINEIQKTKFDMIVTDIPNCIFKFLKEKLDIKLSLYISPPNVPNLFYGLFELNPVTLPALGSPFTDSLTFFERLQNFVFVNGFRGMGLKFMREQMNVFRDRGHKLDEYHFFAHDALIMIQYPMGFAFNISRPPNMVFLNYITPTDGKKLSIEESEMDSFLNIYKKNVYMSQGTIFKNIDFNRIIKIFEELSDVGFILSIKKEVSNKYNFPKNVHLKSWVNQNDLLADKRINAFVSHGGINSIVEAIYHKKPVVALGVALDQVNTAGMVKTRETGISFFSQKDITTENLVDAIKKILEDGNKYLKNTLKISDILSYNTPATVEFSYWLEYGFKYGYKHLTVKSYENLYYFQFLNLDVYAFLILIICIAYWLIKKIFRAIFLNGEDNKKIKQD